MYKCRNCGRVFPEPEELETTYEDYYGVSDLFAYKTRLTLTTCPYCQDEDIIEFDEEEDDDE